MRIIFAEMMEEQPSGRMIGKAKASAPHRQAIADICKAGVLRPQKASGVRRQLS
jgi:hypothetical protein